MGAVPPPVLLGLVRETCSCAPPCSTLRPLTGTAVQVSSQAARRVAPRCPLCKRAVAGVPGPAGPAVARSSLSQWAASRRPSTASADMRRGPRTEARCGAGLRVWAAGPPDSPGAVSGQRAPTLARAGPGGLRTERRRAGIGKLEGGGGAGAAQGRQGAPGPVQSGAMLRGAREPHSLFPQSTRASLRGLQARAARSRPCNP
jgi:hypothetical protein